MYIWQTYLTLLSSPSPSPQSPDGQSEGIVTNQRVWWPIRGPDDQSEGIMTNLRGHDVTFDRIYWSFWSCLDIDNWGLGSDFSIDNVFVCSFGCTRWRWRKGGQHSSNPWDDSSKWNYRMCHWQGRLQDSRDQVGDDWHKLREHTEVHVTKDIKQWAI